MIVLNTFVRSTLTLAVLVGATVSPLAPPVQAQGLAPGGVKPATIPKVAAQSRLPILRDGELIADAVIARKQAEQMAAALPIPPTGAYSIQEVRVAVFGVPRAVSPDEVVELCEKRLLIPAGKQPLVASWKLGGETPQLAGAPVQTGIYQTATPVGHFIIKLRTEGQRGPTQVLLCHVVGKPDVWLRADALANELFRQGLANAAQPSLPAPPPGGIVAGPDVRVRQNEIPLFRSLLERNITAPRVQAAVGAMLQNATGLDVRVVRTGKPTPLGAVSELYGKVAQQQGWTEVTRDMSEAGKTTTIYSLPREGGIVMVTIQPAGPAPVGAPPATGLPGNQQVMFLRITGKVNVAEILKQIPPPMK